MVAPEGAPAQRHRLVDRARPGELLLEPRRVLVRLRLPLLGRNLPPNQQLLVLLVRRALCACAGGLDRQRPPQLALLVVVGELLPLPGARARADGTILLLLLLLLLVLVGGAVESSSAVRAEMVPHGHRRLGARAPSSVLLATFPVAVAAAVLALRTLPLVEKGRLGLVDLGTLLPNSVDGLEDLEVELAREHLAVLILGRGVLFRVEIAVQLPELRHLLLALPVLKAAGVRLVDGELIADAADDALLLTSGIGSIVGAVEEVHVCVRQAGPGRLGACARTRRGFVLCGRYGSITYGPDRPRLALPYPQAGLPAGGGVLTFFLSFRHGQKSEKHPSTNTPPPRHHCRPLRSRPHRRHQQPRPPLRRLMAPPLRRTVLPRTAPRTAPRAGSGTCRQTCTFRSLQSPSKPWLAWQPSCSRAAAARRRRAPMRPAGRAAACGCRSGRGAAPSCERERSGGGSRPFRK